MRKIKKKSQYIQVGVRYNNGQIAKAENYNISLFLGDLLGLDVYDLFPRNEADKKPWYMSKKKFNRLMMGMRVKLYNEAYDVTQELIKNDKFGKKKR